MLVQDPGSGRDLHDEVLAVLPGLPASLAVLALAGPKMVVEAEVVQRGEGFFHLDEDRSAFSSVSPIGTALRDEFLPAKADATVSPTASLDENLDFIEKRWIQRAAHWGFAETGKRRFNWRESR